MGNELCLHMSGHLINPPQHLPSLEPPYRASCIDRARPNQIGVHFVPVEGSEGCAEVRVLIVI